MVGFLIGKLVGKYTGLVPWMLIMGIGNLRKNPCSEIVGPRSWSVFLMKQIECMTCPMTDPCMHGIFTYNLA